ncbi:MAG: glutamate decarboxylase [Legionellales bacterium]|nr:glutamate decarboxylase [Legionellales bacterium]
MAIKHRDSSSYFLEESIQEAALSGKMPDIGFAAAEAKAVIDNTLATDVVPALNTSSYVNVKNEPEERDVILTGMKINIADQTIYQQAFNIHNKVINMLGNLWHCPESADYKENGVFAGAGTMGSTEACLLAGLALKFRWRHWYSKKHGISLEEASSIKPNLVISSCFQLAWEKLFLYMDIEPRIITSSVKDFGLDPDKIADFVDDKTIGVVGILGNHWGGHYDKIWDIDAAVEEINKDKGFQIGIHVDGASGGFIAPFQKDLPAWDFKLKNVLSISTSGHKYGESCPGTGWILWRQKSGLSEFIVTTVTYMGGSSDSYNLNFSRPASGILVQYYKFLRLGLDGYSSICHQAMHHAQQLRDALKRMEYKGKHRFIILDQGEKHCLPVVSARLNPECDFAFDDIDLQHVLSSHNWYVGGYKMSFEHPITKETLQLFHDMDKDTTMFRIVVKGNITKVMVDNLIEAFEASFEFLDKIEFKDMFDKRSLRKIHNKVVTNHC